jgi:two-component system, NarL family, sensor histidine kinase UhpB
MSLSMSLGATATEYRQELRSSIARALHDGPIRELTACVLRLEEFRAVSPNQQMQLGITAVEEHARAALMSLRRMIRDLRDEVPREDLAPAIQSMLDRYATSTGIELTLVVSPAWPPVLPDPLNLNILRIVQEAVSNAVLHAACRHVLVELKAERDQLRAVVSDDGRGIDAEAVEGGGLPGMRERAALMGGRLTARRRHPGTRVQLDVTL